MRTVTVHPPRPGEHDVEFSWDVEPASGLYARQSFNLRFGDALTPRELPADLWWLVALLCLHAQWPLLRPCRIELPVELPPGEREFWLRLTDAAVATLELTWGGGDRERAIEIADRGPRLEPAPAPTGERTALAFSGGKDSLVHLGLLLELGERPLAVTTTAPMPYLYDHAAPRRRTALETVADRPDCELVEVRSNLRECWDNGFPRERGYEVAVNELSDTMLYLAAALAVGWAQGASRVLVASEADLQTTAVVDGALVQHPHLMYSAITQQALARLLGRRGVGHGSLTYPLHAWEVSRLLWTRYPGLRELQYSCWRHRAGASACNSCRACLTMALTALEANAPPSAAGIDLPRVLHEMAEWLPELEPGTLPGRVYRREVDGATVRQLAGMRTRDVARRLVRAEPRLLARRDTRQMLRNYEWLRGRLVAGFEPPPAPGYRHAYLELVDERWRGRLERLYDSEFERAPAGADEAELARARALIDHIAEPLGATPSAPERITAA